MNALNALCNLNKSQLTIGYSISGVLMTIGIVGVVIFSQELHRNANLKDLMDACDDAHRTLIKDKLYGKGVRYIYETVHEGSLGVINGGKQ